MRIDYSRPSGWGIEETNEKNIDYCNPYEMFSCNKKRSRDSSERKKIKMMFVLCDREILTCSGIIRLIYSELFLSSPLFSGRNNPTFINKLVRTEYKYVKHA